MYPYFVESDIQSVGLYQLKDGRFQVLKDGKLSHYMAGYDYILIENRLAEYLNSLNIPQIEFRDAIIWNRRLDKEHKNYKQLITSANFKNYINEKNIEHLNLNGLQIYLFKDRYLFVSPQLKELLVNYGFNYLNFSKGLSYFA